MIKILENDLKSIKYQGQEIKAVYFKEKKIFPAENSLIIGAEKLYNGFWRVYVYDDYIETVDITELDNNILHFWINKRWYMGYKYKENSSETNPLYCLTDNGSPARDDYRVYWDVDRNIWVWLNYKDNIGRFICRSEAEAIHSPAFSL